MTGQVQGKVALVTGGASGIGEAVSELLAREGASVAVTDVDDLKGPEVVARIKKAGHEANFWHQDVTSEERWIEVVAEVMQRYGRSRMPASAYPCRRLPRCRWRTGGGRPRSISTACFSP